MTATSASVLQNLAVDHIRCNLDMYPDVDHWDTSPVRKTADTLTFDISCSIGARTGCSEFRLSEMEIEAARSAVDTSLSWVSDRILEAMRSAYLAAGGGAPDVPFRIGQFSTYQRSRNNLNVSKRNMTRAQLESREPWRKR